MKNVSYIIIILLTIAIFVSLIFSQYKMKEGINKIQAMEAKAIAHYSGGRAPDSEKVEALKLMNIQDDRFKKILNSTDSTKTKLDKIIKLVGTYTGKDDDTNELFLLPSVLFDPTTSSSDKRAILYRLDYSRDKYNKKNMSDYIYNNDEDVDDDAFGEYVVKFMKNYYYPNNANPFPNEVWSKESPLPVPTVNSNVRNKLLHRDIK